MLTKFQAILSISFFFLTVSYEGLISSQIVSPLPIVTFPTFKSVLDAGYKITVPVKAIEDFFKYYNDFEDFVNGFKLRGLHHRWRESFIPDPGLKRWEYMMRHNLSLKPIVDRPKDEAFADAFRLRPYHCKVVEEHFFIRLYIWLLINR